MDTRVNESSNLSCSLNGSTDESFLDLYAKERGRKSSLSEISEKVDFVNINVINLGGRKREGGGRWEEGRREGGREGGEEEGERGRRGGRGGEKHEGEKKREGKRKIGHKFT